MSAPLLRINLLGQVTASYDGAILQLGGPRQRAVLALLVLARGAVVPAEHLVDRLWGDGAPPTAPAVLRSYVSHLRRRLQPGSVPRARASVIAREGPGYVVRLPEETVDAWRFEALLDQAAGTSDPARAAQLLREGLELWRGPALADYADETWAEPEIARLTELRAVALERLIAARLELGDSALLVPELEAMVGEEPLREERWRLLVLALYRAHRQGDALHALQRARRTLAAELGVDPGPALRALEADVLAQAPSLDGPPREDGGDPRAARSPAELVERDRELATLRTALDGLAAGRPGLVVVDGPAGIGKSRLIAEVRRLAGERGLRVLAARGTQLEMAFGFGVVRQLFEAELAAPGRRAELLEGAATGARGLFEPTPGPRSVDSTFAVLNGLYWLTVNLTAAGPLVLAVDDVQWADTASLRYLAYLAHRLDAVPVLVVAALRTGEGCDDDSLLSALRLEPGAVVVRPAPLSPDASAGVVARRLGSPASPSFAAACHRATAGNPLLLHELLGALEADGVPPDAAHVDVALAAGARAVSSLVLSRLRRLPEPVIAIARAGAVLGDGARLPAVAALAGLPEVEAAAALTLLARADVLDDEQPVAFRHPLVRDAVYLDMSAAERELRHERAAQVLLSLAGSEEQVAAHLLRSPARADPHTVAVLRGAARTAAERGAPDSAVTYLRRCLLEPPSAGQRSEVLLELGTLEALVDGPRSIEHLLEARELLDDGPARADVAVAVARTHVFASAPGVATAFARDARARLPAELADHRQALVALERLSAFIHGLETPPPAPEAEPVGDGRGARMLAAALAFDTMLSCRDRDRAVALARFALDGDLLLAADEGVFWSTAANVRVLADDEIGELWNRARAYAHARGSVFAALSSSLWQGFWHLRRGELDEALACCVAALDQDRMWGVSGGGESYIRALEIGCHLDRGDPGSARRTADAALGRPAVGEGWRLLQLATARLLVAEGRHDRALTVLESLPRRSAAENPAWNPWRRAAAVALAGLRRRREAIALAEEEVALLRRWGAPTPLGSALRLLGELLGDAGLDTLRESVAVLAPTDAALERVRAQLALGAHARMPAGEAADLLDDARCVAEERGAAGLASRARAALARRGRNVTPSSGRGRRRTATERRVVDLAADGLDAREIAQRLLLTPGTVRRVLDEASRELGG